MIYGNQLEKMRVCFSRFVSKLLVNTCSKKNLDLLIILKKESAAIKQGIRSALIKAFSI